MTVIKHIEERVAVLIDVQNLYHSAKNLYGSRVNFKEVLKAAIGNRTLVRALAYVIKTESGEESAFFKALTEMGIEMKVKDLQVFAGGAKKADWDVGLAVDAIRLARKVDAIVIASGDGDFIPLVEYLQNVEGVKTDAISFGRSTSMKLKEVVDTFIDLDTNPRKYLLRIAARNGRQRNSEHK